jgi:hypothetical protein
MTLSFKGQPGEEQVLIMQEKFIGRGVGMTPSFKGQPGVTRIMRIGFGVLARRRIEVVLSQRSDASRHGGFSSRIAVA